MNYYLDIETTGLDPKTSEIITIQYQKLDRSGKAAGELVILKAWESSEKDILVKFYDKFMEGNSDWSFIPCGYNIAFEQKFLLGRSMKYHDIPIINISKVPSIDLHPIGIMMNAGSFKGSGLNKISGKKGSGLEVLEFYSIKAYDKIEAYIIQEAREYIKLYAWLLNRMPELLQEFWKDLEVGK